MAKMERYLEQIRTAIYGKDMRAAIHDAIEECYIATKAETIELLEKYKVAIPRNIQNEPSYGNQGQLLRTKGDGSTEWSDVGLPTDAQTAEAVSNWLDDHPEATTTVQDGVITKAKLNANLKNVITYAYATVADMIADTSLVNGMIAQTTGYSNAEDGLGMVYEIKSTLDKTKLYETLANGLYAYPIYSSIETSADKIIFNNDSAVSEIANTALTYTKYTSGSGTENDPYISSKFVYGGDDNWQAGVQPTQIGGKWEIRCSAFVKDLIFGVTFENSKYLNDDNELSEFLCADKGATLLNNDGKYDTRYLAAYAMKYGYAYYPNEDYSNIQAGDVLFYDNGEDAPHHDRFMGTNHCAVFAYRVNDKYHAIWEVGTMPVLQKQSDAYFDNYLVMCARFPFRNTGSKTLVNLLTDDVPVTITSSQTLYTAPCKTTLKAYKQYTAVVKMDLGLNDIGQYYPAIRDTNGNMLSASYSGATKKPADDVYVIPFVPVEDITSVRVYMGAQSSQIVPSDVTLEWVNVFEGIVLYNKEYIKPVSNDFELTVSNQKIDSNSDLNNFTTAGNYTCVGSGVAATITNSPVTNAGFRLQVMEINEGKQIQIVFSDGANADIYYRRNNVPSNIFGTWKKVSTT